MKQRCRDEVCNPLFPSHKTLRINRGNIGRKDRDGTPIQLRKMYFPSEMSSRSLHEPYIVAEGHTMKIMYICYRTISISKRVWCGNVAKRLTSYASYCGSGLSPTPLNIAVSATFPDATI